ncbi:Component of the MICOS complex [Teratosphaeria destructans]|uniref:MICOS complex subunit MIC12 n=1 Tax=Teratosphaeria destructans TaxID=418781 RepID=A0A9W7SXB2_9PEZI|nr:Component of the MICOS complex [Teratosphaeria destructans]
MIATRTQHDYTLHHNSPPETNHLHCLARLVRPHSNTHLSSTSTPAQHGLHNRPRAPPSPPPPHPATPTDKPLPLQLGGITLTTTLLYLTLELHTRTRATQAALLRQQSLLVTNIVEPRPPPPPPTSREVDAGLLATAKDRWNAQLAYEVRRLQATDWSAVWGRVEEGVSGVWAAAFRKGREGAGEAVHVVGDAAGRTYRGGEGLVEGARRAREGVLEGSERAERVVRGPVTAKQREG